MTQIDSDHATGSRDSDRLGSFGRDSIPAVGVAGEEANCGRGASRAREARLLPLLHAAEGGPIKVSFGGVRVANLKQTMNQARNRLEIRARPFIPSLHQRITTGQSWYMLLQHSSTMVCC